MEDCDCAILKRNCSLRSLLFTLQILNFHTLVILDVCLWSIQINLSTREMFMTENPRITPIPRAIMSMKASLLHTWRHSFSPDLRSVQFSRKALPVKRFPKQMTALNTDCSFRLLNIYDISTYPLVPCKVTVINCWSFPRNTAREVIYMSISFPWTFCSHT